MYNIVDINGKFLSTKVAGNEKKHLTISVTGPTKETLDSIKHPGQSYDGQIQELVILWKEQHRASRGAPAPLEAK